jgi:4'-phosphopantetheinyl transferase
LRDELVRRLRARPMTSAFATQLWIVDSQRIGAQALAELLPLLSENERAAANARRPSAERHVYSAAHVVLRLILGELAGARAETLRFATGKHGKPQLDADVAAPDFNLTHSAHLAVVAVSYGGPIGVDIEQARPRFPIGPLLPYVLAQRERRAFEALEDADKPNAFYRTWVRKEAYLKARGVGLAAPMHMLDLSDHTSETGFATCGRNRPTGDGWLIHDIAMAAPWHLACCTKVKIDALEVAHCF